jgi:hypothetical protein
LEWRYKVEEGLVDEDEEMEEVYYASQDMENGTDDGSKDYDGRSLKKRRMDNSDEVVDEVVSDDGNVEWEDEDDEINWVCVAEDLFAIKAKYERREELIVKTVRAKAAQVDMEYEAYKKERI